MLISRHMRYRIERADRIECLVRTIDGGLVGVYKTAGRNIGRSAPDLTKRSVDAGDDETIFDQLSSDRHTRAASKIKHGRACSHAASRFEIWF
jgi:hypothetical protein